MSATESIPTVAEPWSSEATDVVARLRSDPDVGLTGAEAATRLSRLGPNRLDAAQPVPAWRRLLAQF
jgi:magnesium-transporting ATPase (P-type)